MFFYLLVSPSPVSASLTNPVRTLLYLFLIFFCAVVDSESHFSFSLILGTILNFSLLVRLVFFFFVEESLSVPKSEMFNVPLSLLWSHPNTSL